MTVTELRRNRIEAFGEPTGSRSQEYLVKRVAWQRRVREAGDLSEHARRRAGQLANDADPRTTAPKATLDDGSADIITKAAVLLAFKHDPRPGSILTRPGKGCGMVVYKLGRLRRLLIDFSKFMGVLEWHKVPFVSVIQQFNTSTSVARLMFEALLSFVQFEREMI